MVNGNVVFRKEFQDVKMTKIDIISGFLGAGKTTLINKLIREAYDGEKLVLIENEFGEIGIDGGFLKEAGINITEMNSGCICCSLVGDFGEALCKVIDEYAPDRILIEPSGVGKLSDVIKAVRAVETDQVILNSYTVVVDAGKCKMYMKNFGEFFNNQIEHAGCIIFSHTDKVSAQKTQEAIELVRAHNDHTQMITTHISELSGKDILAAMERKNTLESELHEMLEHEHHHHHHHHEDGEECHCHHHEHHHEHEHEHHHHEKKTYRMWGNNILQAFIRENKLKYDENGDFTYEVKPIERYNDLSATLTHYSPDIVTLQECDRAWHHLIDNYEGYAKENAIKTFHDIGYTNVLEGTEFDLDVRNSIYVKTGMFNVIDTGVVGYDGPLYDYPWVFTWAILEDKETGDRFAVSSTHIVSNAPDSPEKLAEIKALTAFMKEIEAKHGIPVIMMGDYNVQPDHKAYGGFEPDVLLQSARYTAKELVGGEYCTCNGLRNPPALWTPEKFNIIDHAMYSMKGVIADRYEVVVELLDTENNIATYSYSDHVPQMFDFKIEKHEHHHDEERCCHEHEHHHEPEHHHEHHHEHGEECTCGCHDHDHGHHHHHHADEVFTSWGRETVRTFSADEIENILSKLQNEEKYGFVIRAKGIVAATDGEWIHFDYIPGEPNVRRGGADIIGKLCVIGSKLNESAISELFGVK